MLREGSLDLVWSQPADIQVLSSLDESLKTLARNLDLSVVHEVDDVLEVLEHQPADVDEAVGVLLLGEDLPEEGTVGRQDQLVNINSFILATNSDVKQLARISENYFNVKILFYNFILKTLLPELLKASDTVCSELTLSQHTVSSGGNHLNLSTPPPDTD